MNDFFEFLGVDFTNPMVLTSYIISIVGFILFTVSSILKRKEMILGFQAGGNCLCAISEIFISAWAGFTQDTLNLIRNVLVIKKWMNKVVSIIFIVVAFVLGIVVFILDFNTAAWWGILPLIATIQFSIIVIIPNISVVAIKLSLMVSSVCWATYGVGVRLYTTTIFNTLTFILALVYIITYYVQKKKPATIMNQAPIEGTGEVKAE